METDNTDKTEEISETESSEKCVAEVEVTSGLDESIEDAVHKAVEQVDKELSSGADGVKVTIKKEIPLEYLILSYSSKLCTMCLLAAIGVSISLAMGVPKGDAGMRIHDTFLMLAVSVIQVFGIIHIIKIMTLVHTADDLKKYKCCLIGLGAALMIANMTIMFISEAAASKYIANTQNYITLILLYIAPVLNIMYMAVNGHEIIQRVMGKGAGQGEDKQ